MKRWPAVLLLALLLGVGATGIGYAAWYVNLSNGKAEQSINADANVFGLDEVVSFESVEVPKLAKYFFEVDETSSEIGYLTYNFSVDDEDEDRLFVLKKLDFSLSFQKAGFTSHSDLLTVSEEGFLRHVRYSINLGSKTVITSATFAGSSLNFSLPDMSDATAFCIEFEFFHSLVYSSINILGGTFSLSVRYGGPSL